VSIFYFIVWGGAVLTETDSIVTTSSLALSAIRDQLQDACHGLPVKVSLDQLIDEVRASLYDGASNREIASAMILSIRAHIEQEPAFAFVAARLLLNLIYSEALGEAVTFRQADEVYARCFDAYFETGIRAGRLAPELAAFNLEQIKLYLQPERDLQFQYAGLQTLYDRYLLHENERRFELPQLMWLRVAMGLALNEPERETRTGQFYDLLSQFHFVNSTPTLFNAGTPHPQLSSCFLTTVDDDLGHIFKSIRDNALLSKWSGGLGNDWTRVRGMGAHIKGTNGKSLGIVPFLKVANDAAVAVNQGGKRAGAVCAYLETWHIDMDEFLDLRKNTGDERRRTHDMHTANWIPDLFMKRVLEEGQWTLFSPDETPELHELYGQAFEQRYVEYERQADAGEIKLWRRIPAVELWRKMITRLFETGHPWLTWKDPANVRSAQDHVGVVHSSNLCTEILLNTSNDETAVCNLGSVNLAAHIQDGKLDMDMLAHTVQVAVRMLDNVIDLNFYPTIEAENANQRHRPIGLGLMGFQDALHQLGISYASKAGVAFADTSMEAISYYALLASAELAHERGHYSSYNGSKWSRGLLPIDTIDVLESERGVPVEMDRSSSMDWSPVREAIARYGMRNSQVMAIAPTATIANIVGVSQSIEPDYKLLHVKSNMSGEFTEINEFLVADLQALDLWDAAMLSDLKYYDGSIQAIDRIPDNLKQRYKTAFELEPEWLIRAASSRQKWIDMAQSLNLYVQEPNGRKLSDVYLLAWRSGLKTTYYLRTLAATQIEKSTLDVNRYGVQPRWMKNESASSLIQVERGEAAINGAVCNVDEEDCEACQ
jgi:ribonucleoside-diphosphate reductase alpha chain